jgi:hypothetical protein
VQESLQLSPTKLFPGFSILHHPAVLTGGRPSGGLTTLLRRDFLGPAELKVAISEDSLLAVVITWENFVLLLCNVYAPFHSRGDHEDFFPNLRAQLDALSDIYLPSATIVAGDLNVHYFRPSKPRDRSFCEFVRAMERENYVLYPKSEQPFTYCSGPDVSTVDYVFLRGLDNPVFHVKPYVVAQHRPLVTRFRLPIVNLPQAEMALGTAYWRNKTRSAEFPELLVATGSVLDDPTPHGLQEHYNKFESVLQLATKRNPRKIRTEAWESMLDPSDIAKLSSLRQTVMELAFPADTDNRVRQQLAAKKKELEFLTTKLMKQALDMETEKLKEESTSHADAWRVLTKMKSTGSQCPITTDKLLSHFSSLAKQNDTPLLPQPLDPPSGSQSDDVEPLDPTEVQQALFEVNKSSAAGPDGISPRFLCSTFKDGLPFQFLFNLCAMCLVLAVVPLQWREATLFALYKGSGDPCDPNNYRAIALMSTFAKLYERLLLRRLLRWFRESRLWLLPQFGFRAGSGCVHAIFLLRTLILDIHNKRRAPVYAAFVDLKKAFPSVGRDALFRRMLDLGIPYTLVAAVRSFYVSNVARIRVDNNLTRDFFVAIGVLEGSVLSPFLFGVLFSVIWDLFDTTPFPSVNLQVYAADSVWFIAYADDLVVLTLSAEKLQEVLNKMARELSKLNLTMRCVFLGTGQFLPCLPMQLNFRVLVHLVISKCSNASLITRNISSHLSYLKLAIVFVGLS